MVAKCCVLWPLTGTVWPAPTWLSARDEPGLPMYVSGCVFGPDGVTPAPGVVVYVYHTDRTGIYAEPGAPPRLCGWIRTDRRGRYAYRSIRPAPYPGGRQPAHVLLAGAARSVPHHEGR